MGIGKEHARGSETIDIRGLGLRMSPHAADPVIEIIYGNEQYIGTALAYAWITAPGQCRIQLTTQTFLGLGVVLVLGHIAQLVRILPEIVEFL